MRITAHGASTLPFPGNILLAKLDNYTAPLRPYISHSVFHHPYKGFGTFELICSRSKLNSWHKDGLAARTMTAAQAITGGSAQFGVWMLAGAAACIAAPVVGLRRGDMPARVFMAQHYVPMMMTIIATTVLLYCAVLFSCVMVIRSACLAAAKA